MSWQGSAGQPELGPPAAMSRRRPAGLDAGRLVELGEALCQELGREYYLTGAGLKAEPAFQAIYQRYDELLSDEAWELARTSGSGPLEEWVVGIRLERLVAPLIEQQLRWEQQAIVRVGPEEVPYLRVPIELANQPDRARRLALEQARRRLVAAELNPLRRERFAEEHRAVAAWGLGSYVPAMSRLMGIELEALWVQCQDFLARSQDLYREALARLVRRRLGVPLGELDRADIAWLFRADRYDAGFPPSGLVDAARRQTRELGWTAIEDGRVRLDVEERPHKQPRAFCAPVRVPEEVYLVLRPRGGHADYRTLWHELGHALHFALVDPDRPFAHRWLGDNSVTEGYAMLWDHLTLDPTWLKRYAGLPARAIADLRYELLVHELYSVRRYAAKLGYELVLHRSDLADPGPAYAQRLTDATLFRHGPEDCFQDVDPAFYAARYLRAWQFEAAVSAALRERFDEDWFRNPEAGEFLRSLMSRGQADPADRLALEITGQSLSFEPLLRRLEVGLQ